MRAHRAEFGTQTRLVFYIILCCVVNAPSSAASLATLNWTTAAVDQAQKQSLYVEHKKMSVNFLREPRNFLSN